MCWRNKFLTTDATSIDDMADKLERAAKTLREMSADGVVLDDPDTVGDDYADLMTTNRRVARKYRMRKETL